MPAILDATTKSLEIVLAGAVSTAQPVAAVNYTELDASAGTATPGNNVASANGTTDVTLLAAPASGKQRVVDSLIVYNADTAAVTVTVQEDISGSNKPLKKATLAAGESLSWTRGSGWG